MEEFKGDLRQKLHLFKMILFRQNTKWQKNKNSKGLHENPPIKLCMFIRMDVDYVCSFVHLRQDTV